MLIAAGTVDEDSLDSEFQKLYEEEQHLKEKITGLKSSQNQSEQQTKVLNMAAESIASEPCRLTEYDDTIVRKLIECVRVVSKTEIMVIFKGGYEMAVEVEK